MENDVGYKVKVSYTYTSSKAFVQGGSAEPDLGKEQKANRPKEKLVQTAPRHWHWGTATR